MVVYKRYLLSSVVTFLSAFLPIVALGLGTIEYSKAALVALMLTAVRAGFKALGEWYVGAVGDKLQA